MDLDRLKAVNDAFGHDAGDRYLQAATTDADVIARIGGDEFAVLVSAPDPHAVAELAAVLQTRFAVEQDTQITALSASVGYAVCEPFGDLTETVIRADGQMYLAKAKARTSG